jgi:hypothetical protein
MQDNRKKIQLVRMKISKDITGELSELRRQLEEKYFDYNGVSPDCSDNPEKSISTTSSSTSSTISALTAACHARGLVIAHSRKLSATLGGSTSTRS